MCLRIEDRDQGSGYLVEKLLFLIQVLDMVYGSLALTRESFWRTFLR